MSLTLIRVCSVACDCTIVPFKPPSCFQECVDKILAHSSYSELTGKYGLPHDIADKIIKAREHGTATSSGWYKKVLGGGEASTVDGIFRQKEHSTRENPMK
jgi:hypothetical protein